MSRSNRPRRGARPEDSDEDDLRRLLSGWARTEVRRGRAFTVQPISARAAAKTYVCPGCQGPIEPGVAHLVVWQQDGVLGDEADLAARRHWHTHCWRIA
ncbi:hypothetical protein [Curtobacterium ammoniigenes]|uniref:hypothetical protein n=1 Tax=Curtobacterium ammoniigenes TaxID=395387 RepID=UPI0009FAB6FE|nr:hypothetical protein [Curtobacterium ammoniigenes]